MPISNNNRVCCTSCQGEYATKGFSHHFNTNHDTNSKPKDGIAAFLRAMERNKLYYVAPNKCIGCNAEQSWFSKNYKFCSSACSATFHNASRAPTSDATTLKISKSLSVTHTKRRSLLPPINQPPTIKLKRVKLVVESKLKKKKNQQ